MIKHLLYGALPLAVLTALSGCGSSTETPAPIELPVGEAKADTLVDMSSVAVDDQPALAKDWYKGAVFMEIFVRSYKDSDGDGIGDFKGLTSQLDYIADLGVEGIWLLPFSESSDKDHGYEVVDYRSIESDYGSREDFDEFLAQAHARGIGVIADYLINHSSGDNPVFADSNNNAGGKRDWYMWQDSDPKWTNWSGDSSWHKGQYGFYYGIFQSNMPDFNLQNEEVIQFHYNNLRYWLNAGMDGFRFDAMTHLVENGPNQWSAQPENAAIMYGIQQLVMEDYSNRYMICEDSSDSLAAAQQSFCGSAFSFYLNKAIMSAVGSGSSDQTSMSYWLNQSSLDSMGLLLANHDSFAGQRIFEQFSGNEAKYRLAAATLLTLPGQPFIYYGEEVGMAHTKNSGGDYLLRAPMSWTADGGFTSGTPYREIANNSANYNAESQMADNSSLYHHYKNLIQLRKATPALRNGNLTLLNQGEVLAFTRTTAGSNVLVVFNYSESPQTPSIALEQQSAVLTPLAGFGSSNISSTSAGQVNLSLAPQEIRIYQY
ncbi:MULTISPECIES: alpha-amylase family glycosyl hydrolase [unclassified Agarivorans]|uniref:alpha-amylase family glycosyl hydrolase n=1 Tax=unclassified Agarivorans TaxID=2636026 RepID=UPI0026E48EA9|nr:MULTISPECIES: alpha-amylase family glycosyl hydrolase [unclassified Agarivorans]MDO6686486.1 alpha-amylase family glycosyl hydrolase [Agarivorans sp. 3_MG-2023]MDO6715304.1 alpha-amylase family glycosyl hydrolase [Agarivorans sp. 2_MG-2023]